MLAPFFHAWERRLASVTKDRVVRPFDWGLDWLAPNGHHQPAQASAFGTSAEASAGCQDLVARSARPGPLCGSQPLEDSRNEAHSGPDAGDRVAAWVNEVMQDTPGFFDLPPSSDFTFTEAPDDLRMQGEAGTLRFPSAVVTPHPENNIVVGRWFPAADEPPLLPASHKVSGSQALPSNTPSARQVGRGRVAIVMSQWNADTEGHIGLAKLLARFGVSALRLSLPYHDARMPPELTRADYIVSSNIVRTVQVCRQAVLDARRAVAWLSAQGFQRIGILGTSLGSCLAMLTSAHEPLIRAQALNHVSPFFADVVWRGLSTRHVRQGLEGHIDLDRLRALWRPISPFEYLERVRGKKTLLVYAKYDLTFPVDLSELLVSEFRARQLPHEVFALRCGHYSTGVAPFKFVDGYVLTKFLRQNL
jgi:dienelactone hydrolase